MMMMDTRATPLAATFATVAVLLLLASCATAPAPAPGEDTEAECTSPKAGLYVLIELEDGTRQPIEPPVLAYWLDPGDNALRLDPLRRDTAASAWVPAPSDTLYLPLQSACVGESARIKLSASDDGFEVLYKREQLRARYGPP
jgi:hypothetical protein